jgi:hypothetical protein
VGKVLYRLFIEAKILVYRFNAAGRSKKTEKEDLRSWHHTRVSKYQYHKEYTDV